jgi:hypothetical protein
MKLNEIQEIPRFSNISEPTSDWFLGDRHAAAGNQPLPERGAHASMSAQMLCAQPFA